MCFIYIYTARLMFSICFVLIEQTRWLK